MRNYTIVFKTKL